jgi:hypothetical protein
MYRGGEDPDISDAQEFLCPAEEVEVTHYEVLSDPPRNSKKKISCRNQIDFKERKRSPIIMHTTCE